MTSAFFNFPSFCIGLYFGLINYALQKGAANKFDISISSKINTFSFLKKEKNNKNNSLFVDNEDDNDNNNKKDDNNDEDNDDNDEMKDNDNDNDDNDNNNNNNDDNNNNDNKDEENNILNNSNQNSIINNKEDNNTLIQNKKFLTENNLPFLKSPIGFINCQKKVKCNILFYIIIIILLLTPFLIHYITLSYFENEIRNIKENPEHLEDALHMEKYYEALNIKEFFTNKYLKILYNMDIEIIVFLVHWLIFILHISGKSNLLSLFTSIKWGIFNKSYFSFIIVSNMVMLFSIYSNETIISINIFTICLYYIFNSINSVMITGLCYIFLELPLKKLVKLILSRKEEENENENEDDNDNDNNNDNNNDNDNDNDNKKNNQEIKNASNL